MRLSGLRLLLLVAQTVAGEEQGDDGAFVVPEDFCIVPERVGFFGKGVVTYLEDCPTVGSGYPVVPLPAQAHRKVGVHPMVCCPTYASCNHEEDKFCGGYHNEDYDSYNDYDEDYGIEQDDGSSFFPVRDPLMSDQSCLPANVSGVTSIPGFRSSARCVAFNMCADLLDSEDAPKSSVVACGFDEPSKVLMICCPEEQVLPKARDTLQAPRYPVSGSSEARECEDRHELCGKWRDNGACRLDQEYTLSKVDVFNSQVSSKQLFDFMQLACQATCGWCGDKGCVDEHPRCASWARTGMCVVSPFFMAQTCRESCGLCGFLSLTNKEEQVVAGKSYTDFDKDNFDCGRYKPLCEIEGGQCPSRRRATKSRAKRSSRDKEFWPEYPLINPEDPTKFFCGATTINDHWVLAAAHCYADQDPDYGPRKVKVNTIRDGTAYREVIEVKRVYKHPFYVFPRLYNNIALLELGRRLEYDHERFGDSPTCIDQNVEDMSGRMGKVQGYGEQEDGTSGTLQETTVTIIDNDLCKARLRHNISASQADLAKALPFGLSGGQMCAQGIYNKNRDIFSGPCRGDDGGPLSVEDKEGRTTLVGIVSGGFGCGNGVPNWYTKVTYYRAWISCVVEASRTSKSSREVTEACRRTQRLPLCEDLVAQDQLFGGNSAQGTCIQEEEEIKTIIQRKRK